VQVREADASRVTQFADALPADMLVLCGIFGNVPASDIERTVAAAPDRRHCHLDPGPPAAGSDAAHPGAVRRRGLRRP